MNITYYVLVFDRETDCLLVHLDMGEEHSRCENSSVFVVYMKITTELNWLYLQGLHCRKQTKSDFLVISNNLCGYGMATVVRKSDVTRSKN